MKRVGAWQAFCAGVVGVLRFWPIALLFYGGLLLLAGLLLLPVVQMLVRTLGFRLAAHDLADGVDAWLLATIVRTLWRDPEALLPLLRPVVRSLPAWPLLLNLPFVVLSAGALSVYVRGLGPLGRAFGTGLARFGPPFVALLAGEVLLLDATLAGTIALLGLALWRAPQLGVGLTLLSSPVLVAASLAIPWWFGYARVWMVVHRQGHLLRAIAHSGRFLWKNLGAASVLELLVLACPVGIGATAWLAGSLLPDPWWGARLLVDQLLVAGWVGTRLVRLAAQARLLEGRVSPAGTAQLDPLSVNPGKEVGWKKGSDGGR